MCLSQLDAYHHPCPLHTSPADSPGLYQCPASVASHRHQSLGGPPPSLRLPGTVADSAWLRKLIPWAATGSPAASQVDERAETDDTSRGGHIDYQLQRQGVL